jgi:hypothetical protein
MSTFIYKFRQSNTLVVLLSFVVFLLVLINLYLSAFPLAKINKLEAIGACPITDGSPQDGDGIVNGEIVLLSSQTWQADLTNSGVFDCSDYHVIVPNGVTLSLQPYITGTLDYEDDFGVEILAENITVEATGVITASGLGYAGGISSDLDGKGPGGGVGTLSGTSGANGASHGGLGALGSGGFVMKDVYGDLLDPIWLGSGGGRGDAGDGGNGGGAIKLNVNNQLTVNGQILANGNSVPGTTAQGGGGSGGSINILVQNLSGSGTISAQGGSGGVHLSRGGAGGGGRVHVQYQTSTYDGMIITDGGNLPSVNAGESGTNIVINTQTKTLYLHDSQRWVLANANSFQEWFPDIENLIVCSSTTIDPECSSGVNVTLSLDTINKATVSNAITWYIEVKTLLLDAGSTILLTGLGYDGGNTATPKGYGPGGGNGTLSSIAGGAGGSYGGLGANGSGATATTTYDTNAWPTSVGSGGGKGRSIDGGSGGGSVIFKILTNATLDGDIITNGTGNFGVSVGGGGGSGGSILVIANQLGGSGNLTANGGVGGGYLNRGGAGGGGRITLRHCPGNNSYAGTISVLGGQQPASRMGQVGTVFVQEFDGGIMQNLDAGLASYLDIDFVTDLTDIANLQNCYTNIGITTNDNDKLIADFNLFITSDIDATDIEAAATDQASYFRFANGFENLDGFTIFEPNYNVYVKKGAGARIAVCPNASNLSEVNENCTDMYYLYDYDSNVDIVDINGTDYWKVNDFEGGGIFSEELNTLPSVLSVELNNGNPINLTVGTTTNVTCKAMVEDVDGYLDLVSVEAKLYRSGVGHSASLNDNNMYVRSGNSQCIPSNGFGNTQEYNCTFAVQYHAEPTDIASEYEDEEWVCRVIASDFVGTSDAETDMVELNTMMGLTVTNTITYGILELGDDTGNSNEITIVTNAGNRGIDVEVAGNDMCLDYPVCSGSVLGVNNQQYATTGFSYGAGQTLGEMPVELNINIAKPTNIASPPSTNIYWGIGIPGGINKGLYTGQNFFTAIAN